MDFTVPKLTAPPVDYWRNAPTAALEREIQIINKMLQLMHIASVPFKTTDWNEYRRLRTERHEWVEVRAVMVDEVVRRHLGLK